MAMFPGKGDNFGGPFGSNDGPFSGGIEGGPPPADAMFESMLDGSEENGDDAALPEFGDAPEPFLAVGLHFFEKIRAMGK